MLGTQKATTPARATREAEICNIKGLHARASAALAREALKHDATITLTRDGLTADAASIMDLLMLTAHKGCVLSITAEGADAEKALDAICALIADKFGEGE